MFLSKVRDASRFSAFTMAVPQFYNIYITETCHFITIYSPTKRSRTRELLLTSISVNNKKHIYCETLHSCREAARPFVPRRNYDEIKFRTRSPFIPPGIQSCHEIPKGREFPGYRHDTIPGWISPRRRGSRFLKIIRVAVWSFAASNHRYSVLGNEVWIIHSDGI